MNKLRIATVFSGIGAFEQALERASIKYENIFACDNGDVILDIDYEKKIKKIKSLSTSKEQITYIDQLFAENTRKTNFVKQSYLANYKIKNNLFFQDIKFLDGRKFKNKIDIFVGGTPCQSFSTVGKQKGFKSATGTLFFEYARLVKEIQPKVFIFENVKGLYKHAKGETWKVIQIIFNSLGYKYKFEILNSNNFGIPQNRSRLFVVGFKDKNHYEHFNFPKPIKLKLTVQQLLLDSLSDGDFNPKITLPSKFKSKGQSPPEKTYLTPKIKKYVLSTGTKNFYSNPKINLKVARPLLATMNNKHRAGVDNYYDHDGKIRMLANREAYRLMGFPDNFKQNVSNAQSYKQIGNSIVVDVLIKLNKQILDAIKE